MKQNSNRVRRNLNAPELLAQELRDDNRDVLTKDGHLLAARVHFDCAMVICLMISDPESAYELNDRLEFPVPVKRLISILELTTDNKRKMVELTLDHVREHVDASLDTFDNETTLSN